MGKINFEINSIIIGKLILLDQIIYPEERKINQAFEISYKKMQIA